jgi:hypothetical protein
MQNFVFYILRKILEIVEDAQQIYFWLSKTH